MPVVAALLLRLPDAGHSQVVEALQGLTNQKLSSSMISRIKRMANVKCFNTADNAAAQLPALAAALKELGHHAQILYCTIDELAWIHVREAKRNHDTMQDEKKVRDDAFQRVQFDQKAAFDKEKEYLCDHFRDVKDHPEFRIIFGWTFGNFPHMRVGRDKYMRATFTDACHVAAGDKGGVIFSSVTQDAGGHIVPLLNTRTVETECYRTHAIHLQQQIDLASLAGYDIKKTVTIMDGEKGAIKAHEMLKVPYLTCSNHRYQCHVYKCTIDIQQE